VTVAFPDTNYFSDLKNAWDTKKEQYTSRLSTITTETLYRWAYAHLSKKQFKRLWFIWNFCTVNSQKKQFI